MEDTGASGSKVTVVEEQSQPTLVLRSSKAAVEVGRQAVDRIEKQLKEKIKRSAKDDQKIDEIFTALESDIRREIFGLRKTLHGLSKEPKPEENESKATFNERMKQYEVENVTLVQGIENLLSELMEVFDKLLQKAKEALVKLSTTSNEEARAEVLRDFQNETGNVSLEIEKAVERVFKSAPSNHL